MKTERKMKVLLINGSPKNNGNTYRALSEVAATLNSEGVETEIISIGKKAVQGCIACGMCGREGRCTFRDELYNKIFRAVKDGIDGLIVGSPVYYGGPNGSLCALLDRVFYSLGPDWQFKPGTDIKSTEFGISGGITFPRFLLLPSSFFRDRVPTTQIKASVNVQDRPEYERDIYSTSYTYLWSKGRFYYQFSPLGVSHVRLYHIEDSFLESLSSNPFLKNAYQTHLDIGSSFTVYYTTDASVVPQGAYSYVRLKVDLSGNLLSLFDGMLKKNDEGAALMFNTPYSQYARGELTIGRTFRIGERFTLATRFLAGAGYAYGNSSALPFEKHFYSGGANSLRGWQARALGPGYAKKNDNFIIPSQTGDLKLEANAELRFGIYKFLSGAVFTDVGNIWTINGESSEQPEGRFNSANFPGSLAADWGFGLRFNLNVLLLRLDMGLKLRDPALDGSKWVGPSHWFHSGFNAIHLGVGYPF